MFLHPLAGSSTNLSMRPEPPGLLEDLQRFYEHRKRNKPDRRSPTRTGFLDGGLPSGIGNGGWKRPEPGLGLCLDFLLVRINQAAPWPSTHCVRNVQFLLLLGNICGGHG